MDERRRRVNEIFRAACEVAAEQRDAWLEVECGGDSSLRREVEAMLAAETPTVIGGSAATSSEGLGPRDLLSHYRLVRRLGAGGMGEVWLANDEKLGRQVALKFPSLALMEQPSTRHRLLREARAAAALEHPAVCRVFELGQVEGRDFIAMEHVQGETLAARLATGPIALAQALEWGAALAAALEEAHEKGIVHRDLKPGNVMITPAGRVKVLDFGLARVLPGRGGASADIVNWTADLTAAGTILGTPAYMAPELLKGAQADERSDLWALGCILYQMLSGEHPFRGDTSNEFVAAILEREPDVSRMPADTPIEVRLLVGRCLKKDPSRRLRHAGDLRLALEEAREPVRLSPGEADPDDRSRPPSVTEEKPERPSSLLMSRRHLLFGSGAVGLLGAGFGAGMLLQTDRGAISPPVYNRLTFRRGLIRNARFAPDQKTVLYGALWDGDECRTFVVRPESPESHPLDLPPSTPLSISSSGEVALLLGTHLRGLWGLGTLARVPLAGGAPRELVERVTFADWSPDGSELAIMRQDGDNVRLEFPIGNPIFEKIGGELSFPRISPAGDSVAFFEHNPYAMGGNVVVVDRSGKTRYRSPDFLELYGISWRGEEVWFTGGNERRIFRAIHAVRPPGALRLVARLPGNVTLHDISADGRLLIAHTIDRSEFAALPPGGTTDRNLSWLDGSAIADLSSDGRTVLFTETAQGGGRTGSVYIRGTDGSAAVRLGEGRGLALSPDGRWVIAGTIGLPSPHLVLLPTGAGEARRIEVAGFRFYSARWLPDGERLVLGVDEEGRGEGLYVYTLAGGRPRAITPAGIIIVGWAVAPDGSAAAVTAIGAEPMLYPLDETEPRPIQGLTANDSVRAWIDSGLLVTNQNEENIVFVVDPASGNRQRWRELAPTDPAGIMGLGSLRVTPDGRSYAYWWHRALSDLYLVDDLGQIASG